MVRTRSKSMFIESISQEDLLGQIKKRAQNRRPISSKRSPRKLAISKLKQQAKGDLEKVAKRLTGWRESLSKV